MGSVLSSSSGSDAAPRSLGQSWHWLDFDAKNQLELGTKDGVRCLCIFPPALSGCILSIFKQVVPIFTKLFFSPLFKAI